MFSTAPYKNHVNFRLIVKDLSLSPKSFIWGVPPAKYIAMDKLRKLGI
jgi:hypothetical protein